MTTTAAKSNQSRMVEAISFDRQDVDRENKVIRNVKIVGVESKNKRDYLPDALRESIRLFEGAKVYVDHLDLKEGKNERKTKDRFGKLVGVHFVEGEGLFAKELRYLESHPLTDQILEAIEEFNDFGLSHDVAGQARPGKGGRVIVESIDRVYSVDIVQDPATVTNFFESEARPAMTKVKVFKILRESVEDKIAAKLLARMTEMDMYDEGMEMEVTEEMDQDSRIGAAFKEAVMAIMDADLSNDQKAEKIRMLLDAQDAVGSGATSGEMTMEESTELAELRANVKRLQEANEQLARERDREAVVRLLESAEVEATDIRVEAVLQLPADKRANLVESFQKKPTKPAQSKGVYESYRTQESESDFPTDFEQIKNRLAIGR